LAYLAGLACRDRWVLACLLPWVAFAVLRMALATIAELHVPPAFDEPVTQFWWPLVAIDTVNQGAGTWLYGARGLASHYLSLVALAVLVGAAWIGSWPAIRSEWRMTLVALMMPLLGYGYLSKPSPCNELQVHGLDVVLQARGFDRTARRHLLTRYLAWRGGPAGQLHLAQLAWDDGDAAAALGALDAALVLAPHTAEIHLLRARLLEHLGRRDEARTGYRAALDDAHSTSTATAAREGLERLR
jgi:tetratricopeptide (TPR) repeat protein